MERYQEYQDSGVEWIGEIPKGWKVARIKEYFYVVNGATPSSGEPDNWDGDIPFITPADYKTEDVFVEKWKRNITEKGLSSCGTSLIPKYSVIVSNRAPIGSIALNKEVICTNQGCKALVPKKEINTRFIYCCLSIYNKELNMLGKGTTFMELASNELANFQLGIPSVSEQRAIVSYLDAKCAVIDSEIARRQDIIAKCQEYRQSLIAETVTRGLDPAAPLRDSGVEWIGKIPKGWKVEKLKYTLVEKKDAVKVGPFGSQLKGNDFAQEGVPVYNQRTVLDNDFKNGESFISEEKYKILKSFSVNPNDILLTTRGTIGKVAIVPDDVAKGIIHPCIIKFTLNMELLLCEFLAYVFNDTQIVYQQLLLFSNATTIPVVYSESLKNIALTVPPLATQQAIVSYLDTKCAEIDGIIKNNTEVVGKLEELKKSLIFEVVTGKRRIG